MTSEDVSQFLNDYPEINRLIDGKEFSTDRIQTATKLTVDEWNDTPPILASKYTSTNFPYKSTLFYGVISVLFRGEAAAQKRNELPYASGGLSVNDSSKGEFYLNYSELFRGIFLSQMKAQKTHENLNAGWRTISSDYSRLGYRG